MKSFLSLINNKIFLWIVIILGIVGVFAFNSYRTSQFNAQLDTYKRQLTGQLSDKEREIQTLNTELGLSQSQLVTQKELNKKLAADKDMINAEFEKFKKEHDLIIKSKDETIAQLRQQISGGQTNIDISDCVLPKDCVISYEWQDTYKRFQLKDADIFIKDNEIFNSSQIFVIKGEIYKQKNGFLETRRVQLNEVYKVIENDKEVYRPIPESKIDILDASFVYTDSPDTDLNSRLFTLRFFGGAGYNFNNIGVLGGLEILHWKNFGLNSSTFFDTDSIKNSQGGLGIDYNLKIFNVPLNIAPGISIRTSFNNIFKHNNFGLDLIFFIN